MKNFKINAITALVVGLNVATAHAARTTNPVPNPNVLYWGTSKFENYADATNVNEPSHTAIGQSNLIYSVPESSDPNEDQGSSSAFGNQNTVKGKHADAFGDGNDAYGKQTQSFGDNNKVYADGSIGYGINNKIGAQPADDAPKKTREADANTNSVSVFGANNAVVGKNILALGKDNKITDTSTTNATVIGFGSTASAANATAIGTAASALANETVAIGQKANASGQNSNAFGSQANATGTSSLAVGTGSVASNDSTVAIGNDSTVTGASAVAVGASATSTGKWSTALGDSANAKGEKSVALSKDSYAKDDNSVALGSSTITRSATNVTTATVNGITYSGFAGNSNNIAVVSVGSDKTETYTPPDHSTPGRTVTITPHTRQIINVGAGEISATSTDAINGSQLYMVADQVGKNKTRIDNIRMRTSDVKVKAGDNIDVKEVYDDANQVKTYTVSTTKDIKANSYTINNSNIKIDQNGINAGNKKVINVANGENDNDAVNVSQLNKVKTDVANNTKNIATNTQNIANNTKAINTLNKKVNDVDRKSRAGIAGVAAIASAPSARKDGKSMVSTGVAHHRGESAIAIKASRNSDNGHWSTNVNGAADTRGQFTVGAGVGYEW